MYFFSKSPLLPSSTGRRRIRAVSLAMLLPLILFGCAVGRDFTRPPPGSFTLGKTTPEAILAEYGAPWKTSSDIINEQKVEAVSYAYSARGDPLVSGVTPARSLVFHFYRGVLAGYNFDSTFKLDHTDFDEMKIKQIKKGQDTCNTVIVTLGPPTGKQIYPLIGEKVSTGLLYSYSQTKKGAFSCVPYRPCPGRRQFRQGHRRLNFYIKRLAVACDENNVVTDIQYSATGKR